MGNCLRSEPTCTPEDEKATIEVVTRRSVEVRESFHEPDENKPNHGWDMHKPYPHNARYEEGGGEESFLTTALV
jgi:hypothetical protein